MNICSLCGNSGRIADSYCVCEKGQTMRQKLEGTQKSIPTPDLVKRYSDFDLMK